jgi:Rrf2 family transcriptional regulator, iron-sulfur cluster assembly transcription factor
MSLLPRKGALAITAVIDIAVFSDAQPVAAKALAERLGLPPRHLEPVLQALVRAGVLKGRRGPRGGYELGREQNAITADAILRAAGTVENDETPTNGSPLLTQVIVPALAQAEEALSVALMRITVEDLVRAAQSLPPQEVPTSDAAQ